MHMMEVAVELVVDIVVDIVVYADTPCFFDPLRMRDEKKKLNKSAQKHSHTERE